MTFKEQLKQELANTRRYTFKDVVLRVEHPLKFWVLFSFLSFVALKVLIAFGEITSYEFWHALIWLSGVFLCAVVLLPEEERKSDN